MRYVPLILCLQREHIRMHGGSQVAQRQQTSLKVYSLKHWDLQLNVARMQHLQHATVGCILHPDQHG